jgi:hypothetical protein
MTNANSLLYLSTFFIANQGNLFELNGLKIINKMNLTKINWLIKRRSLQDPANAAPEVNSCKSKQLLNCIS